MGEPILAAIFFDDVELLFGGLVLFGSATITPIGIDDGARWQGGWGRE
jgi:hypothetical protein